MQAALTDTLAAADTNPHLPPSRPRGNLWLLPAAMMPKLSVSSLDFEADPLMLEHQPPLNPSTAGTISRPNSFTFPPPAGTAAAACCKTPNPISATGNAAAWAASVNNSNNNKALSRGLAAHHAGSPTAGPTNKNEGASGECNSQNQKSPQADAAAAEDNSNDDDDGDDVSAFHSALFSNNNSSSSSKRVTWLDSSLVDFTDDDRVLPPAVPFSHIWGGAFNGFAQHQHQQHPVLASVRSAPPAGVAGDLRDQGRLSSAGTAFNAMLGSGSGCINNTLLGAGAGGAGGLVTTMVEDACTPLNAGTVSTDCINNLAGLLGSLGSSLFIHDGLLPATPQSNRGAGATAASAAAADGKSESVAAATAAMVGAQNGRDTNHPVLPDYVEIWGGGDCARSAPHTALSAKNAATAHAGPANAAAGHARSAGSSSVSDGGHGSIGRRRSSSSNSASAFASANGAMSAAAAAAAAGDRGGCYTTSHDHWQHAANQLSHAYSGPAMPSRFLPAANINSAGSSNNSTSTGGSSNAFRPHNINGMQHVGQTATPVPAATARIRGAATPQQWGPGFPSFLGQDYCAQPMEGIQRTNSMGGVMSASNGYINSNSSASMMMPGAFSNGGVVNHHRVPAFPAGYPPAGSPVLMPPSLQAMLSAPVGTLAHPAHTTSPGVDAVMQSYCQAGMAPPAATAAAAAAHTSAASAYEAWALASYLSSLASGGVSADNPFGSVVGGISNSITNNSSMGGSINNSSAMAANGSAIWNSPPTGMHSLPTEMLLQARGGHHHQQPGGRTSLDAAAASRGSSFACRGVGGGQQHRHHLAPSSSLQYLSGTSSGRIIRCPGNATTVYSPGGVSSSSSKADPKSLCGVDPRLCVGNPSDVELEVCRRNPGLAELLRLPPRSVKLNNIPVVQDPSPPELLASKRPDGPITPEELMIESGLLRHCFGLPSSIGPDLVRAARHAVTRGDNPGSGLEPFFWCLQAKLNWLLKRPVFFKGQLLRGEIHTITDQQRAQSFAQVTEQRSKLGELLLVLYRMLQA